MSGTYREACTFVPLNRSAGVIARRAFATELEQAPARFRALVVEGLGKLALLVEWAAIAAVVNRLAVEG